MYNLGDDSELDRMSREAAGRYETPGNANWQALSEELDKVMPQEKKKRRFLFWWIFPELLVGVGILYGILKHDGNTPTATSNKIHDQTNIAVNPQTNQSVITKTDTKENSKETQTSTTTSPQIKETGATLKKEHKNDATALFSKKSRNSIQVTGLITNVQVTHTLETELIPVKESASIPTTGGTTDQSILIKDQKIITKEISVAEQPLQSSTVALNKTEKVPVPEEPTVKEEGKKIIQKNSLPTRGKGWSISLLTGVDKSTVKFKYGYTPGFNIGLELAYHFNDKWAVRTGGIFTQKQYKLAGVDFTAPKGTPASNYKLDQVEGSCHMWEVPLLVRYTISSSGKKAVTLNTGLSSYFMTHEDYDYYYPYNGVPTSRSASYNSSDSHPFSIVHFSAGFENRLSKSMSLQIEPYAKIPLGGVGFGNIQLSSFGINLSVQYRQPHKN